MNARHSQILKITGEPVTAGEWTIVPASVTLEGSMLTPCFHLGDIRKEWIPPILRVPIADGFDAAWVRARLPRVFDFDHPLGSSENEKSLLDVSFVAFLAEQEEGIAFQCSDYYGRTALAFSPRESDTATKQQIAETFWRLLLSDPDELEDFQASVIHLGAPIVLQFGCEDGEPFMRQMPK